MSNFARPLRDLGPRVIVAAQPTAGQGLSLDPNGRLPVTVDAQAVPHLTADPDASVIRNGLVWLRSDLDQVRARIDGTTRIFREQDSLPSCIARLNANQSIASATPTALTLTEDFDNDTMHDPSANPTRITIKTAGRYLVVAHGVFENSALGNYRTVIVYMNGATTLAQASVGPSAGDVTASGLAVRYSFALNDYVELLMSHNAGVSINALGGAAASSGPICRMSATFEGV